jgi:hypothetical protein
VKRGASPEYIRVLSITVATPALQKLSEKYPGVLGFGEKAAHAAQLVRVGLLLMYVRTLVPCVLLLTDMHDTRRPEGVYSDDRCRAE